jgi:hypothetical protein
MLLKTQNEIQKLKYKQKYKNHIFTQLGSKNRITKKIKTLKLRIRALLAV